MFLLILEREEGTKREKKPAVWQRNINQLPPMCTPTKNRTCNLLVYGTMLQPTEPPVQGPQSIFLTPILHSATLHLPGAACFVCAILLMHTTVLCEYSYWTNCALKKILWVRNVHLCPIAPPEKWQCLECVSALSQPGFSWQGLCGNFW